MTQLDEDAVCGSIGYAACLLQLVYIIYTSCGAGGLQSRAKTFGCSTSSWLSGKIRSQASPPPISSSFILPLLLCACSSPCLFIYFYLFLLQPTSLLFLPTSLSSLIAFPSSPSSSCLSVSLLLLSPCSYL